MAEPVFDRYKPSFLDRLIDPDRNQSFKSVLLRDVEDLLNTHRPPDDYFEGLEEAGNSIANFGLMDMTGYASKSDTEKQRIYQHIEQVIENFEPRLESVRVTPRDPEEVLKNEKDYVNRGDLYLRIQANIRGASEDIIFESVLNQGHHTLRGEST